jgi:hypothetical protein
MGVCAGALFVWPLSRCRCGWVQGCALCAGWDIQHGLCVHHECVGVATCLVGSSIAMVATQ